MTLSSLRSLARLIIPEINSTDVLSDANFLTLVNLAASEFIKETDALPTSSTFTITTNIQTYALSTFVSTFGKIRKEGAWIYNKVTLKWVQIDGTTIAYLNQKFPAWMNASAGLPLRFWIEGDEIGFDPKPSATYAGTNYAKIYYFKRSVDMSADAHYPFSGSTAQYPRLANYESTLLDYVKYLILPGLGKGVKAEEAKGMFYARCAKIKQELSYRPDLIPNHKMDMPTMRNAGGMFQ